MRYRLGSPLERTLWGRHDTLRAEPSYIFSRTIREAAKVTLRINRLPRLSEQFAKQLRFDNFARAAAQCARLGILGIPNKVRFCVF